MVICLNISFLALFFIFFHVYMKKKKTSNPSLKKKNGLLISLSSIKTELAINFLKKKNFCTWPKNRAGAERVKA